MNFITQYYNSYFADDAKHLRLAQIILLLAAGFFLLHPLIYIPGLRNASSMPRYAALGAVAAIMLMLWSLATRRSEMQFRWNVLFSFIGVFFFWCLLSLNWTLDIQTGLTDIVELLSLVLLAIILGQVITWRSMQGLMIASVIGAVGVALIGIGQNYGFNPLGVSQLAPPSSLFTNKNFAALYLDLVIPFALVFILLARTQQGAWLAALAFTAILTLELLIRSRGTWLALIVGLVVMLLLMLRSPAARVDLTQRLKSRYQQLAAASVIAAAAALMPSSVFTTAVTTQQVFNFEQHSSASIRLVAYANSLQMIQDNPLLGVGQGGFRIGFRPYMFAKQALPNLNEDIYLVRLHSDPLQYFVELGVVGGLLFIAMLAIALLLLYRMLRRAETGSVEYFLSLGILVALVVGITHSLVDFPLRKPSSAIQFWSLLGMTAGLQQSRGAVAQVRIKPLFTSLLLGMGLLLAVFIAYFYSTWISASRDLQQALQRFDAKDCVRATSLSDASVQSFPFDYQSRHYRVQIYSSCLNLPPNQILQVMSEELAIDPYNTRALLTRGWLLATFKYLDAAETDFRRVAGLLPNRASGFIGLGQVASLRGKPQEAIGYYQQAAKLEPNNQLATRLLNTMSKQ